MKLHLSRLKKAGFGTNQTAAMHESAIGHARKLHCRLLEPEHAHTFLASLLFLNEKLPNFIQLAAMKSYLAGYREDWVIADVASVTKIILWLSGNFAIR